MPRKGFFNIKGILLKIKVDILQVNVLSLLILKKIGNWCSNPVSIKF